MSDLESSVDALARETNFSGVVRLDQGGTIALDKAYGWASRAHRIPNTTDTRFAVASVLKGLTALTVVSLVVDGRLSMAAPARSILGSDLPLIADDVTVEHLLAHRSGIGDYLDEDELDDINEYVLGVPVHELATTEDFLRVLDGHPTMFAAGERFFYCNGGYLVLALIAERVAQMPFHDLVQERVCIPAGMRSSDFPRSDELPGDAALGYLGVEGLRTNVFHLPVRGTGDGGIYTTTRDLRALWSALFAGDVVPDEWVETMVAPRSLDPSGTRRYGLGFWVHQARDVVWLEGFDAGVSARTAHDRAGGLTYTVISNTSDGAWPIARLLAEWSGLA